MHANYVLLHQESLYLSSHKVTGMQNSNRSRVISGAISILPSLISILKRAIYQQSPPSLLFFSLLFFPVCLFPLLFLSAHSSAISFPLSPPSRKLRGVTRPFALRSLISDRSSDYPPPQTARNSESGILMQGAWWVRAR